MAAYDSRRFAIKPSRSPTAISRTYLFHAPVLMNQVPKRDSGTCSQRGVPVVSDDTGAVADSRRSIPASIDGDVAIASAPGQRVVWGAKGGGEPVRHGFQVEDTFEGQQGSRIA